MIDSRVIRSSYQGLVPAAQNHYATWLDHDTWSFKCDIGQMSLPHSNRHSRDMDWNSIPRCSSVRVEPAPTDLADV